MRLIGLQAVMKPASRTPCRAIHPSAEALRRPMRATTSPA